MSHSAIGMSIWVPINWTWRKLTGLSIQEVFCIRDDRLYFGYIQKNSDNLTWHMGIASINLSDHHLIIHSETIPPVALDTPSNWKLLAYEPNRAAYTGSLYIDGCIYICGTNRTVVYDIESDQAEEISEVPASPYTWEIDYDNCVLVIQEATTGVSKTVTIDSMAQNNTYMQELLKLRSRKVWGYTDRHRTDGFFYGIKIINDDIYIVGEVMNRSGAVCAVVFRYDFHTEQIEYAGSMTGFESVPTEYDFIIKE